MRQSSAYSNIQPGAHIQVKRLIWLYFWLILSEGALRKWILPGLANPLLIIRDPVVILIYLMAGSAFPKNPFVPVIIGLGVFTSVVSMAAGGGNILVNLYGLRSNFLHLPLIFLIPEVFSIEDVKKIGKWLLISSIPMALLVADQFKAGPDAWINTGAGGGVGQLDVGFGKIRPPGTFSFTNGLVTYLSMLASFVLYAPFLKKNFNRVLLLAATGCLILMVAISGSRAALASVLITVAGLLLVCLRNPVFSAQAVKIGLMAGFAFLIMGSSSLFQDGLMVTQNRIETGGGIQEGIVQRFFGDFIDGFNAASTADILGAGLGVGTNAGSGLLNNGDRAFLLAEGEWSRVVLESGPVLGFAYLFLRVAIACYLLSRSMASLKENNPLPLLIFTSCFLPIITGQFGQPTALGFAVFGGGLCLAATNDVGQRSSSVPVPLAVGPAPGRIRGRSRGSELLIGK